MNLPISYVKASDGSANASVATIQAIRSGGATTIQVDTVQGIPTNFIASMGTPHTFEDPITGEEITVISEATAVDFAGHVDGNDLEIDEIAPGYTDNGSEVGDIVIIRPTTLWADLIAESLTPAGVISPFAGASAPNSWLMCDGSAVSRTTYERLFDAIGTTFGDGDGSTTFNLPDLRSRVPLGADQGTFALDFAAGDVNTSNEQITVPSNTSLQTGTAVVISNSGGAVPTDLTAGNTYYVIRVSATVIKLATSLANAVAGTAIDITAQGSGTNTITVTYTNNSLGAKGGEETHALTVDEIPSHVHDSRAASRVVTNQGGGSNGSLNDQDGKSTGSTGGSGAHNNLPPFLALNYIIKT